MDALRLVGAAIAEVVALLVAAGCLFSVATAIKIYIDSKKG